MTRLEQEVTETVNRAQVNVEAYFNAAMERVSGWYKRKVQWIIIGLALFITVALNVDTLAIIDDLMQEPSHRTALVSFVQSSIENGSISTELSKGSDLETILKGVDNVAKLGIPLGWNECTPLPQFANVVRCKSTESVAQFWLTKLAGLLITVSAVSLGAPFWFDMLNKLVNLRMAGAKK